MAGIVVAIIVSGVAVAALRPADHPMVNADSGTAWLLSAELGSIGRTNAFVHGPVATTSTVSLPTAGDATTVRRGTQVVVDDSASGTATVLDVRTLRTFRIALNGRRLDTVDGHAVLIDPDRAVVTWLNADGQPETTFEVPDRPGERWVIAGAALWLPLPRTGAVARVDRSGVTVIGSVFTPGAQPMPAALPDGIALTDPPAGAVVLLYGATASPRRFSMRIRGDVSSLHVASSGEYAVLVRGASYTVVGLTGGHLAEQRSLGPASHHFGAATLAGGRLFVADDSVGAVVVAPIAAGPTAVIPLAGHAAPIEVFAGGATVWANDPGGPNAVAFKADVPRHLAKYRRPSAGPSSVSQSSPSKPPSDKPTTKPPAPTKATRTATATGTTAPKTPARTAIAGAPKPTQTATAGPPEPTKTATTAPKPVNRASITSPGQRAEVKRCQQVSGTADVEPGKALLLAHRRTNPPDDTSYIHYVDGTSDGNVPKHWQTTKYLGTAEDQWYQLTLIIIDVDDAKALFGGDDWIHLTSLPGARADSLKVHQTSVEC